MATPTPRAARPRPDVSTASDGIPDYDVNHDGTVGNEADRAVDLGSSKARRRSSSSSSPSTARASRSAASACRAGDTDTGDHLQPAWFTKNILNPDFGGYAADTTIRTLALGCARDDAACARPPAPSSAGSTPPPSAASTPRPITTSHRQTPSPPSKVGADKSAPTSSSTRRRAIPTAGILALDDQPEYAIDPAGKGGGSYSSDGDFNDVVFLIERSNGGVIASTNQVKATDVPGPAADTWCSKLRLRYSATFPSPGCDNLSDIGIQFYWSVDNKPLVLFGLPQSGTSGDISVDVLAQGVVGQQVYWKAKLPDLVAVLPAAARQRQHGLRGPSSTASTSSRAGAAGQRPSSAAASRHQLAVDRVAQRLPHPRPLLLVGLVRSHDAEGPSTVNWDAGLVLANQAPSTRLGLFTGNNGAYLALSSANATRSTAPARRRDRVAKTAGSSPSTSTTTASPTTPMPAT